MPERTEKPTHNVAELDVLAKILLAAVALIAFCLQPMLPFVDMDKLLGGTCFAAIGIIWAGSDFVMLRVRRLTLVGIALLIVGAFFMALATQGAGRLSAVNDIRCEHIQNDMLAASPLRSDGPAIFQALGCHPRGDRDFATPKPRPAQATPSRVPTHDGQAPTSKPASPR